MKIQSHDIAMQSHHIEYKSILESQLNFETYFTELPDGINFKENPTEQVQAQKSCMCSFLENHEKTLTGIIQSLIQMLQQRVASGEEQVVDEENVNGYIHMSQYQKFQEHESLDFSTVGNIQTDSGSLDIKLNFSMSRDFVVENRIDIYSPFDPLVINLDGMLPELDTETFSFDLDNDGKKEQISSLKQGSGFLALDKNKDGIVNQGSELFGTLTGNGFEELSAYDEDNNDWIDENDSIFESLQIWLKHTDSKERELVGIGEVGIGAIFLDSALSEFTYKTELNQTLGEMKSSGIFLHENGRVGNISQIDFATRGEEIVEVDTASQQPLAKLLQA